MSDKINAFIVNRNLVTTLKGTVEFLLRDPRVRVVIWDQNSTYPPLMQYYRELHGGERVKIIVSPMNAGPHSVWSLKGEFNCMPFIVADSDCAYQGVPSDWLDMMLEALDFSPKVGFSLRLDDLPDNELTREVRDWEAKYWARRTMFGWTADVDTTFALHRAGTPFQYQAIRMGMPYTIRHIPWYLTPDILDEEWQYYLDHASHVSTWGQKLIQWNQQRLKERA